MKLSMRSIQSRDLNSKLKYSNAGVPKQGSAEPLGALVMLFGFPERLNSCLPRFFPFICLLYFWINHTGIACSRLAVQTVIASWIWTFFWGAACRHALFCIPVGHEGRKLRHSRFLSTFWNSLVLLQAKRFENPCSYGVVLHIFESLVRVAQVDVKELRQLSRSVTSEATKPLPFHTLFFLLLFECLLSDCWALNECLLSSWDVFVELSVSACR